MHKLVVQGNVYDQANITGSSDIEFQGNLLNHVQVNTKKGNIIVKGNVGSNTTLKSMSGNVSAKEVGENTTLKSMSGDVSAEKVGANTTLESMSGNVSVLIRDPSATINTASEVCYVNGVSSETKREKSNNISFLNNIHVDSSYVGSSFDNMNTITFFVSRMRVVNSNTVIINGVEQKTTPSQPRNSHASANTMPKDLDGYIKSFINTESFQDAFKRLNIETKEGLSCNISLDVPNIPVFLKGGQLYDWESLKKLPVDSNNRYTDPMSKKKFTLADIMPGRTICTILENQIKKVEQKNTLVFKH